MVLAIVSKKEIGHGVGVQGCGDLGRARGWLSQVDDELPDCCKATLFAGRLYTVGSKLSSLPLDLVKTSRTRPRITSRPPFIRQHFIFETLSVSRT